MNESKISTRYAKAIFELAQEENLLENIKQDFDLVKQVLEIDQFQYLIKSPVVPVSQKKLAVNEIFSSRVNKYTLDFLLLTIENKREQYLEQIILDFNELYKKALGITEVQLTTAVEVDEKIKQEFTNTLKKILESKIDLQHNINPDIIGGFILRIDDRLLDLSVASQLKHIKKELTK